jgi:hypothetical protein
MAGAYGRGGVSSTRSSHTRGDTSAYDFSARSAQDYLTGDESKAYGSAMDTLASTPRMKKSGKIKKAKKTLWRHKDAIDRAGRLRDVASTRVLGDFQETATQHSKPWLQRASEGLVAGETTRHSLAGLQMFGGEGARTGKHGRDRRRKALIGEADFEAESLQDARGMSRNLASAGQGDYGVEFLGDRGQRNLAYAAQEPQSRMDKLKAQLMHRSFTQQGRGNAVPEPRMTNAARAYTGMGGFNWQ